MSLTPLKALRLMCRRCTGGATKAIRECAQTECPAWPFRMGKHPTRKGTWPRGKIPPGFQVSTVNRREKN